MEFKEVINRRQSCRKFTDQPVSREQLVEVALTGRLAPSGCNSQRWVFVIVDDPEKCALLAQSLKDPALGVNTYADQIPAYIAVVRHPARSMTDKQNVMIGKGEFSDVDIGIAAQQICLAATDMGLASVMLGWMKRELVAEALSIPDDLEVPLLIGIGYPKNDAVRKKDRYPAGEIIRVNDYGVKLELQ